MNSSIRDAAREGHASSAASPVPKGTGLVRFVVKASKDGEADRPREPARTHVALVKHASETEACACKVG